MSKTTFEKLGISYEERDGIFYPVLVAGTEKADIDVGKYSCYMIGTPRCILLPT